MPHISKATAPTADDLGVMLGYYGQLADYTVGFESYGEDMDAAPAFRGLPDNCCQSPHWGYVLAGQLTFRYVQGDEVYRAGDAYYAPPGHPPVVTAGTEIVEFSPAEAYARTMAVVAKNMKAMRHST